jgi:hypothetical protein
MFLNYFHLKQLVMMGRGLTEWSGKSRANERGKVE